MKLEVEPKLLFRGHFKGLPGECFRISKNREYAYRKVPSIFLGLLLLFLVVAASFWTGILLGTWGSFSLTQWFALVFLFIILLLVIIFSFSSSSYNSTSSNQNNQNSYDNNYYNYIENNVNSYVNNGAVNEEGEEDVGDKLLLEPFYHLIKTPGKNVRAKLVEIVNEKVFNLSSSLCYRIEKYATRLHEASLLLDDIADKSEMRRGDVASYIKYGIAPTVNSALWIIMDVVGELTVEKSGAELCQLCTKTIVSAVRGQSLELYFRDRRKIPSIDQYKQIVDGKTGQLFAAGCEFMRIYADEQKTLFDDQLYLSVVYFLKCFGYVFQVLDDYRNLTEEYSRAKGFGDDISEGGFSLPIIYSCVSDQITEIEKNRLKNILWMQTKDITLIREAANIIFKARGMEMTLAHAKEKIAQLYDFAHENNVQFLLRSFDMMSLPEKIYQQLFSDLKRKKK